MSRTTALGIACAASVPLGLAATANAQDATADFYRGKTVTIIASTSPGGGIDLFARQLARHIVKFLPGNPQAVVTNMPGAGTKVAAKSIYNVQPKDGSVMGTVLPGALLEPLRVEAVRKDYDPLKFNYIGNGNAEALTTVVQTRSGISTLDDMFANEVIVGTPGGGSSVHETTMVAKNVLGMKLKVVTGYPGVREVALGMERGELHGIVGLAFSTTRQFFPDYVTGAKGYKVIAQDNLAGHPELNKAGVPLSISKAKTKADRDLMEFYQTQSVLVRVYIMPPGVPADRVDLMRKAFMATVQSKEFQEEVAKSKGEAIPQSGEEIQALIAKMYASPPELIARLAKAAQAD